MAGMLLPDVSGVSGIVVRRAAAGGEESFEELMQSERPSGRRALLVRMTPSPRTLSP
jgi:hypothetical protein